MATPPGAVIMVTELSVEVLASLLFPAKSCTLAAGNEVITVPVDVAVTEISKVVPSFNPTSKIPVQLAVAVPERNTSSQVNELILIGSEKVTVNFAVVVIRAGSSCPAACSTVTVGAITSELNVSIRADPRAPEPPFPVQLLQRPVPPPPATNPALALPERVPPPVD